MKTYDCTIIQYGTSTLEKNELKGQINIKENSVSVHLKNRVDCFRYLDDTPCIYTVNIEIVDKKWELELQEDNLDIENIYAGKFRNFNIVENEEFFSFKQYAISKILNDKLENSLPAKDAKKSFSKI